VLLVVGAIVGSITVTAVRTQFGPVVTAPLAKRRQFGQVVSTAFRIERESWRLFFGIGALFVVVGLITAGLQSLVMSLPAVDEITDALDSRVSSAIVALAIGTLQFGIAYWLVLNATIAAIGEMEEGRSVGVLGAYQAMWRRIAQLVSSRLRALIIVVALSITIIGIPWAILYGGRWLFLEQAVLLEGQSAVSARKRSEDVVKGRFLYALGSAMAVAVTGIVIGPVIGVLLVLLTSTSLVYVNILSSLLYLVLIPFVGIALTLLYFDLRISRAERDSTVA
jgi:hypothetical protein